jgi:hypothetical protein
MALFNYEDLKSKTILTEGLESYDYIAKYESIKASDIYINSYDTFDIFLSHSYKDKDIIPVLKKELESMGYKVYVDWITDKLLSREEVTKETAKVLQKRMQQSKCLFFATSENSPSSKWMPWELGYFDGIKDKRVAVLPISTQSNGFSEYYKGQEYLGLYCWVLKDKKDYIKDDLFIRCETYGSKIYIKEWMRNSAV